MEELDNLSDAIDRLHGKPRRPLLEKLQTENKQLREALRDMLAGWTYIRREHGDLYGVGWDRAEDKAVAALNVSEVPDGK